MRCLLAFLPVFGVVLLAKRSPCSDVLFLIDHSESQSPAQFELSKNFVKAVIAGGKYGSEAPDFAALGFGSTATPYFGFNQSRTVAETVVTAESTIVSRYGSTHLKAALDLAMTKFWPGSLSTHPSSYKRLQVIITDGVPSSWQHACPTPPSETGNTLNYLTQPISAVKYFQKHNIHTVVVAIGLAIYYDYEFDCFVATNSTGQRQLFGVSDVMNALKPTLKAICATLQSPKISFIPTAAPTLSPTSHPLACPSGRYKSTSGDCKSCPRGKYQSYSGMSYCLSCASGKYQPAASSSFCYDCPRGAYQKASGSYFCLSCPAAKYQPYTGYAFCYSCPAGKSSYTGASYCFSSSCPSGRYKRLNACLACASGKYQSYSGYTFCYSCPVGKYQPYTGSSFCYSCATSRYQPYYGYTFCYSCPSGKTSYSGYSYCFSQHGEETAEEGSEESRQ